MFNDIFRAFVRKTYSPDEPRDERGRWTDGLTAVGDEDGSRPPQPGEPFVVFRVGSSGALDDRNAGNADAVAAHLARAQSDEGPRNVGGVGQTITAYQVETGSEFTTYNTLNVGRVGSGGSKSTQVGRAASKGRVTYSFPKGGDWKATKLQSVSVDDVLKTMTVDGYQTFDDSGSLKGAQYIRRAFASLVKKGDFEGHPFRGNQYADGKSSGIKKFPESLGVQRKDMPQIQSKDMSEFVQWAKEQGIEVKLGTVAVGDLKPAQEEYSAQQAAQMPGAAYKGKSLTVSSDNYVLDGHNRYVRLLQDDPEQEIKVLRIDLPAREALALMARFPKAFSKDVADIGATKKFDPAQPRDPAGTSTGGQWTGDNNGRATGQGKGSAGISGSNAGRDSGGNQEAVPRSYGRGNRSVLVTIAGVRVGARKWDINPEDAVVLNARGIPTPSYLQLQGDNAARAFSKAISVAKEANPAGAAVYVYPDDDYKKMRMFVTTDGKAGIAVKPDGDIVSVFNTPGGVKGVAFSALHLAVQNGGRKLDAFDTVLPIIYAKSGFSAASRLKWDDEQAPSNWSKEQFKAFNNGEPDTGRKDAYKPGEGKLVDTYDAAIELQTKAIKKEEVLKLDITEIDFDWEKRILDGFVSFQSTGDRMMQLISALHTSRVSAYGFTVEAEATGITRYEISEQIGDDRICPVCEVMNGKQFEVEDARASLDQILHVDDPESLRTLQAWPDQDEESVKKLENMTDAELVDNNWNTPPFHPECRGILVPVGEATPPSDTPSFQAAHNRQIGSLVDTLLDFLKQQNR